MQRSRALWTFTLLIVATSIGVRVWHRGDLIPGWDVISAAQGLWLVSTKTPGEIVAWYVAWLGHLTVFWNLYVVPAVLLPGALASVAPWLYWNHVVAFALTLAVLLLVRAAYRIPWAHAWIVLLAWMTSSALVTQSVVGLAYVTALLPHAVAVWAIMRLRERSIATIAAGVVVWFLGWQAQELGRTVCLTYLAAAIGVGAVPMRVRLLWAVIGGALLGDSLWHPSINTASFTAVGVLNAGALWDAVAGVARRLFAPPWIDLPSLLVLGVVAACLARADRWLLRLVLLLHVGLTVVLALQRGADGVWGRRFIVVDFYALVAVIAVASEWVRQGRVRAVRAFVALLIAGALWQTADTVRFARTGFEPGLWGVFTMPFAHTTVDYYVTPQDVRWSDQLVAEARAGRRLILAYNFSSYAENATNPAGIPERLYLTLGPEAFARDVAFFGESSRWTDLRARNPAEIDAFVDSIKEPGEWVGWYALHPNDEWPMYHEAARHRAEVTKLLMALERRFTLRWEAPLPDGPSHIQRFTLAERVESTALGR